MNPPKLTDADKQAIKAATTIVLKYSVCKGCEHLAEDTFSPECTACKVKIMKEVMDEEATDCRKYIDTNHEDCKCGLFGTGCRGYSCDFYTTR